MSESSRRCRLRCGPYLGEISALCFLHLPPNFSHIPLLLAGTGSQLLLYDLEKGRMVKSFHVFEGIRVHGITCSPINGKDRSLSSPLEFKIALFGERRVKLFKLCIETKLGFEDHPKESIHLVLFQLLPKFSHWVLDVSFLKDYANSVQEGSRCLAIGCSDNSVCIWDILQSTIDFEVRCPDRCLLYSMRLWGDKVEALLIASGTIYNEIIVWKVVPRNHASLRSPVKDHVDLISSFDKGFQVYNQQYEVVHIGRLIGHEGSIFRIAWSSDGSKLISVSDDRSARLWEVHAERKEFDSSEEIHGSHSIGHVLFGHNARIWDCSIYDSLIVTAGEDCTCRVWGLDGYQLKMIREHIGRGIWRCLYDPNSSLLVTAGFDSALKAQQLQASLFESSEMHAEEVKEITGRTKIFTVRIPHSSEHIGLMDSKSEYVRCLHFAREDTLYVATNNGYVYHAKLSNNGDVKWTELVQASEAVPIVCMDLLSRSSSNLSSTTEDWIAVGDGKGHMTIVSIVGDGCTPEVGLTFTWSAGLQRQLLGTYWCKSLGTRFIFTSDPRGRLRLWRLGQPLQSLSLSSMKSCDVSLIAEFVSCFGIRIMCLNASLGGEVLVCGDLRGNLVVFPLVKDWLLGTSVASEVISTLSYFKGAHGISSVCSISVASFSCSLVEICSTGGDACICYLEYDTDRQNLEFIGMKQVKELSLVRCVSDSTSCNELASGIYAIGFSSTSFLIWNLMTEAKVIQVACGGWRRPYSYYLGDEPEMKNCFAFVKDEVIYIHSCWGADSERKIYPQNLHLQFHGREMHSICFISAEAQSGSEQILFSKSCWIATGCEDGTVRLTSYDPCVDEWSASKLLGEHVGGSAVRSICFVSKMHTIGADVTTMSNGINRQNVTSEDQEDFCLLISVGAKRVLTCWKQNNRIRKFKEEAIAIGPDNGTGGGYKPSLGMSSSISFQWLSTDMPTKYCSTREIRENTDKEVNASENIVVCDASYFSENSKTESKSCLGDKFENDWRYLAVTAFLVKVAYSRVAVCFVVVACSDATLTLRALLLPYRLWFDVASLVPLSSPVLALQHVITPMDNVETGRVYLVISGSTDGSVAFWDLTESVENFVRSVSNSQVDKYIDCQKRPRTGRGSQGGRWWKALGSGVYTKNPGDNSITARTIERTGKNMLNTAACGTPSKVTDSLRGTTACTQPIYVASLTEVNRVDSSLELCRIRPLHVLNNVHQSGVNCLHISSIKNGSGSNFGYQYYVLSGGDDQALHCLLFDLQMVHSSQYSKKENQYIVHEISESETANNFIRYGQNQNYSIRFSYHHKVTSSHSSAVKGIWTDGCWVFSTGLDQRIRCWLLDENGKLTERACLIISVPEPEALDARACGNDCYQIIVAGRGMQMVEFSTTCGMDDGDLTGL
ncbi:WD repeat-containing protein [Actinidia chinensis var. chinensis]|uniref:WD repeat-containing protein n=1 Tax=Actinidia chinensis var. chinensis TaxID=1590841 RepID=A0A2R6QDM7_ACTCC|nr:WD repeat-containing protein [Actinidia chinensis var. chinensis]